MKKLFNLICLLVTFPIYGQIYEYTDAKGQKFYCDSYPTITTPGTFVGPPSISLSNTCLPKNPANKDKLPSSP